MKEEEEEEEGGGGDEPVRKEGEGEGEAVTPIYDSPFEDITLVAKATTQECPLNETTPDASDGSPDFSGSPSQSVATVVPPKMKPNPPPPPPPHTHTHHESRSIGSTHWWPRAKERGRRRRM